MSDDKNTIKQRDNAAVFVRTIFFYSERVQNILYN